MTQEFRIWKPEHDGHAPPNWREGMEWSTYGPIGPRTRDPFWHEAGEYRVPAEALNSPNDDASGDVDTWKRDDAVKDYNSALIEKAVKSLRAYPAEELAKHGITLAPEKDWATELYFDVLETGGYAFLRNTELDQQDDEAIELLRTRFEQMIAERSKRDA